MSISKKKQNEFNNIFKLFDINNFYIDIKMLRNLFESDFYEHFLSYVENKLIKLLETSNVIILHININSLIIQDTYYYDKIIKFSKLMHKYTSYIKKIILYGNSPLFMNLMKTVNITLGINIHDKIIFSDKEHVIL